MTTVAKRDVLGSLTLCDELGGDSIVEAGWGGGNSLLDG